MSFSDLKKQSKLGSLTAKLVKEVEKMNNNASSGDDRLWKLECDKAQNGYAIIRFLPAPNGEDLPFVKLYSHAFQGPGGWFIENSLTTLNQKDPVSELNSELWNNGTDAGKEIARKQKRKLTYVANMYEIDFKEHQLMLINTNVKHNLSDSAYNDRRSACESVAELLKVETLREASEEDLEKIIDKITPENYQKALYVIQEIERTQKAAKAIEKNDLETLGALIYASHNGLQHQYKVSCEELDFLVAQAKKNKKVLGARMMGGGFGGCTINLIAKSEAKAFADSVSTSYKNKFNKECSVYFIELSDGTHIVQ